MADYKELYIKMLRASEEAVNELIAAQQACEETYIEDDGSTLELVFELPEDDAP